MLFSSGDAQVVLEKKKIVKYHLNVVFQTILP